MKKEDFVALGIEEDIAEKAAKASAEELKAFIPKTRFDEVNAAKGNFETSYNDIKKQLEALKGSDGDVEALKQQIAQLQTDMKTKDSDHEKEINALKMANAIMAELGDTTNDPELVAGLLDQSKLILGDDGKVTGLTEQIKDLKESKAFLFKSKDPEPKNQTGFQIGSVQTGGNTGVGAEGGKVDLKSAIAAKLNNQNG